MVALATLEDTIQKQAGLDPCSDDQVRIQSRANFIIVSTSSEERARKYEKITCLTLKGTQYEVSSHVPAPANTVTSIYQKMTRRSKYLIVFASSTLTSGY